LLFGHRATILKEMLGWRGPLSTEPSKSWASRTRLEAGEFKVRIRSLHYLLQKEPNESDAKNSSSQLSGV
jgi:hypothetical protein